MVMNMLSSHRIRPSIITGYNDHGLDQSGIKSPPRHAISERTAISNDRPSMLNDRPSMSIDRTSMLNERQTLSSDRERLSNARQSFANDRSSFPSDRTSIQNDRPNFASDRPKFTHDRPSFTNDRPNFVNDRPSFTNERPSFVNDRPGYSSDRQRMSSDRPSMLNSPLNDLGNSSGDRSERSISNQRPSIPNERPNMINSRQNIPHDRPSISSSRRIPSNERPYALESRPATSGSSDRPNIPSDRPNIPTNQSSMAIDRPGISSEQSNDRGRQSKSPSIGTDRQSIHPTFNKTTIFRGEPFRGSNDALSRADSREYNGQFIGSRSIQTQPEVEGEDGVDENIQPRSHGNLHNNRHYPMHVMSNKSPSLSENRSQLHNYSMVSTNSVRPIMAPATSAYDNEQDTRFNADAKHKQQRHPPEHLDAQRHDKLRWKNYNFLDKSIDYLPGIPSSKSMVSSESLMKHGIMHSHSSMHPVSHSNTTDKFVSSYNSVFQDNVSMPNSFTPYTDEEGFMKQLTQRHSERELEGHRLVSRSPSVPDQTLEKSELTRKSFMSPEHSDTLNDRPTKRACLTRSPPERRESEQATSMANRSENVSQPEMSTSPERRALHTHIYPSERNGVLPKNDTSDFPYMVTRSSPSLTDMPSMLSMNNTLTPPISSVDILPTMSEIQPLYSGGINRDTTPENRELSHSLPQLAAKTDDPPIPVILNDTPSVLPDMLSMESNCLSASDIESVQPDKSPAAPESLRHGSPPSTHYLENDVTAANDLNDVNNTEVEGNPTSPDPTSPPPTSSPSSLTKSPTPASPVPITSPVAMSPVPRVVILNPGDTSEQDDEELSNMEAAEYEQNNINADDENEDDDIPRSIRDRSVLSSELPSMLSGSPSMLSAISVRPSMVGNEGSDENMAESSAMTSPTEKGNVVKRGKRKKYQKYTPADRIAIGKFCFEHGPAAARKAFQPRYPEMSESVTRGFRDKYKLMIGESAVYEFEQKRRREMHVRTESLPRGRPRKYRPFEPDTKSQILTNVSAPPSSFANVSVQPHNPTHLSVPPHNSTNLSVPSHNPTHLSVPPHNSTNLSVSPHSPTHLSVPPHNSTNVTVPPHNSTTVTVPPHNSTNVTVSPHNSSDVSVPPHNSSDISVPPHNSTNVSVPPHNSINLSVAPHSSIGMSVPPHISSNASVPSHNSTNELIVGQNSSNPLITPYNSTNPSVSPHTPTNSSISPRNYMNTAIPKHKPANESVFQRNSKAAIPSHSPVPPHSQFQPSVSPPSEFKPLALNNPISGNAEEGNEKFKIDYSTDEQLMIGWFCAKHGGDIALDVFKEEHPDLTLEMVVSFHKIYIESEGQVCGNNQASVFVVEEDGETMHRSSPTNGRIVNLQSEFSENNGSMHNDSNEITLSESPDNIKSDREIDAIFKPDQDASSNNSENAGSLSPAISVSRPVTISMSPHNVSPIIHYPKMSPEDALRVHPKYDQREFKQEYSNAMEANGENLGYPYDRPVYMYSDEAKYDINGNPSLPRTKRFKYQKYSPEDRYNIGKLCNDIGLGATVKVYREQFPRLNESVVRTFRNKYRELLQKGNGVPVAEAIQRKPSRRSITTLIESEVVSQLRQFKQSNIDLTDKLVVAVAENIIATKEQKDIGPVKNTVTKEWASSLLWKHKLVERQVSNPNGVCCERCKTPLICPKC